MVRDGATLVGLALLSVGMGMAWLPLGLIVPGVLLLIAGVAGHVFDRPAEKGGQE